MSFKSTFCITLSSITTQTARFSWVAFIDHETKMQDVGELNNIASKYVEMYEVGTG